MKQRLFRQVKLNQKQRLFESSFITFLMENNIFNADDELFQASVELESYLNKNNYSHLARGKFNLSSLLKKVLDPAVTKLIKNEAFGDFLFPDFLPSIIFKQCSDYGCIEKQVSTTPPSINYLYFWIDHIGTAYRLTHEQQVHDNLYFLEHILLTLANLESVTKRNSSDTRTTKIIVDQEYCAFCYKHTELYSSKTKLSGSSKYCSDHIPMDGSKNPAYRKAKRKKYDKQIPRMIKGLDPEGITYLPNTKWYMSQTNLADIPDRRAVAYRLLNSKLHLQKYIKLILISSKLNDDACIAKEMNTTKKAVKDLKLEFTNTVNHILLNPYFDETTNEIYSCYETAKKTIIESMQRNINKYWKNPLGSSIRSKIDSEAFYSSLTFDEILSSWLHTRNDQAFSKSFE